MDGAHRFVERKLAEAVAKSGAFRALDLSSAEAYIQSVNANREQFRTIVGAVDRRLPPPHGALRGWRTSCVGCGLVAFYAAALDRRIGTSLVCGYFDSSQQIWAEPI